MKNHSLAERLPWIIELLTRTRQDYEPGLLTTASRVCRPCSNTIKEKSSDRLHPGLLAGDREQHPSRSYERIRKLELDGRLDSDDVDLVSIPRLIA